MNPRIARLAEALKQQMADVVVIQEAVTLRYFTGLHEDGHERFLGAFIGKDGQVNLICPALTETQARRSGLKNIMSWRDGESAMELVKQLCSEQGWTAARVLVDDFMKAGHLLSLQQTLPGATFVSGGETLQNLMRSKDADEIDLMRQAGSIADAAWEEVKPLIRAGQTELDVVDLLKAAMKQRGGRPTFAIVAAGELGAEPHHGSDESVLKRGDIVVCDFGCEVHGYQADITRMVAVEIASEEAKRVYKTVFDAHMAGRAAAKPGVSRTAVDGAARKIIVDAGYGEFFTHRLGHGIGMKGHEEPNLTPGDSRPLYDGDCFSIEPGIYLPGHLGVRIENIVALINGECVSLNAEPESELPVV